LLDIANSANAALARFGFPIHPTDSYRYFVGDGRDCLVRRALPKEHRDDQTIGKCAAIVTEEYGKRWVENTKPYAGIPELLSALQKLGVIMAVLSNKPHEFTQLMVDQLLSDWSFHVVLGLKPSMPPKPDPGGALQIAKELDIAASEFVYLGDTNTDMKTANAVGMYAAGALWGFRTADELLKSGAKVLVDRPSDVLSLF
jgi:phosphoglycolate phosphatase